MLGISLSLRRILKLTLLAVSLAACSAAPNSTPLSSATAAPGSSAPTADAIRATSLPSPSPSSEAITPTEQRHEQTAIPVAPSATISPESAPTRATELDIQNLPEQIYRQIKAGNPLTEIADSHFPLPDDIHPQQIKKYFQLGDIYFALVLQPSINVVLELPQEYKPSFSGMLVGEAGTGWLKYLELRNKESTDKNNPYYLWAKEGQLYLSIVDQLGAGSGEGNMKLARLSAAGTWEIAGCYYFGASYNDPGRDGDYFAFSQYLERHRKESASLCQNVEIVVLS